jgi:hypothetical protein
MSEMSSNSFVFPPIPPAGEVEVPIIKADLSSPKKLTPDGIAGILVPHDTTPREGYVILQYTDDSRIKQTSIAVASACVGDDHRASLDKETLEVYNVVPQDELLEILIRIYPETRYRVQIIVYY